MKRRLFTILCAVSLLLCVAVCVMWVRSYRRVEGVALGNANGRYTLCASDGRLWCIYFATGTNHTTLAAFSDHGGGFVLGASTTKLMGFAHDPGNGTYALVTVPFWSILLASAALGICLFRVRRKSDGSNAPRCNVCGYDLRATPERCPECGGRAGVVECGSMRLDYGNTLFRVRIRGDRVQYLLLGYVLADERLGECTVDFPDARAFLRTRDGKRIRLRGIGVADVAEFAKWVNACEGTDGARGGELMRQNAGT